MGSRSKSLLITLMTLLSVTLIVVVITLGVGGQNAMNNPEGSIEPVHIGTPIILSLGGLESNDVSVPLYCEAKDIDTERGSIKVCEAKIDDILPLCVTDDTVSGWYVIYASCGGYFPMGGVAQLIQKDGCHGNINLIVDPTFDSSTYEPPCGCGGLECCDCGSVEFYKIIFDVVDDCISLDANHLPAKPEVDESGCVGCEDFNCWIPDPDCTLQKEVTLKMWEDWMGCECPDQSFEVMLAHKSCFHEFPPK